MKRFISFMTLLLVLVGCSQEQVIQKPEVNSVYYEIFVGSFYDTDGDGIGDLKGVMNKLDYIQSLGVTGIWLMPIHPSPTYHKYDVVDYEAIDPSYGTMEDFDALVQEMDAREMDLILDMVLNHSSAQHPWFIEAKNAAIQGTCDSTIYCDYYNFQTTSGNGFTKIAQDLYYESVFWDQMPDLNLYNDAVKSEFDSIFEFWLDKGVDGFRLDATTHYDRENVASNTEILKWINHSVKSINPNAYIVGEAWTSNTIVTQMYASGIDSFFNFDVSQNAGRLVKSVNNEWGHEFAQYVKDHNDLITSKNENAVDAVFISNHDNNRSAGYLSSNLDKQKLVSSVAYLMPGNVFIYYGEEVGMLGSGKDENKRLPMPWGKSEGMTNAPTGADYTLQQPQSVEEALKSKDSLLNHLKNVIKIRNQYPSISRGDFEVLDAKDTSIYALEYEDVIVVHNFSKETKTFIVPSSISDTITLNGLSKRSNDTLNLEGYSSVVIVK